MEQSFIPYKSWLGEGNELPIPGFKAWVELSQGRDAAKKIQTLPPAHRPKRAANAFHCLDFVFLN